MATRNLHQEMVAKHQRGDILTITEFFMYENPVYAEHIRCGFKDEDLEWNVKYIKKFAMKYAKYVLQKGIREDLPPLTKQEAERTKRIIDNANKNGW
jgi:hypothetical protein